MLGLMFPEDVTYPDPAGKMWGRVHRNRYAWVKEDMIDIIEYL